MIRVVHPGSGSWFFLPITDFWSRGQKGTGSRGSGSVTLQKRGGVLWTLSIGLLSTQRGVTVALLSHILSTRVPSVDVHTRPNNYGIIWVLWLTAFAAVSAACKGVVGILMLTCDDSVSCKGVELVLMLACDDSVSCNGVDWVFLLACDDSVSCKGVEWVLMFLVSLWWFGVL